MDLSEARFHPLGRVFAPEELIFYADKEHRSLDEALLEADLLISAPHAASKLPAEIAPHLPKSLTQRLQFDFTDCSTSPLGRRWAELDRRVIYVENPHPRLIRDANRPRPADLEATLREAFARIRSAGPGQRGDLAGVDAIRPVNFAFLPVLEEPTDHAGWTRLVATLTECASRGLEVYERTRADLLASMVEIAVAGAHESGRPRLFVTLGLHDTMNHTVTADGAVAGVRPEADRLPQVVALSNRGDADGDPRGEEPVSMRPDLVRLLAATHRTGFAIADAGDVALNRPYLGGYETTTAGVSLRQWASEANDPNLILGAVQAEFRREFILGETATAEMMSPGTGWPEIPADHIDRLARACMLSWDQFRAAALTNDQAK